MFLSFYSLHKVNQYNIKQLPNVEKKTEKLYIISHFVVRKVNICL